MPEQLSNFQKDLVSSSPNSELMKIVQPMLDQDTSKFSKPDLDRVDHLRGGINSGLVGLEYLTGLKRNKAKTFYDEHPVQGVATDILKNSPMLGAGVAAGGIGINYARQFKNLLKTEPGYFARRDNQKGDPENATRKLHRAKGQPDLDENIVRLFGDAEDPRNLDAMSKRMKTLDQLGQHRNQPGGKPGTFEDEFKAISGHGTPQELDVDYLKQLREEPGGAPDYLGEAREKKLKGLSAKAYSSKETDSLRHYVDMHTSMQKVKDRGATMDQPVGHFLHDIDTSKSPILDKIKKFIAPTYREDVSNLAYKRLIASGDPSRYSPEVLKKVLSDVEGIDFSDLSPNSVAQKMEQSTFPDIRGRAEMKPGYNGLARQFNSNIKFPLIAGAATAAGGTGLYHLVKMIQNQAYGKDKVKDWKKNSLKASGNFDEADRIK